MKIASILKKKPVAKKKPAAKKKPVAKKKVVRKKTAKKTVGAFKFEMFTSAGDKSCQKLVDSIISKINGNKKVTGKEIEKLIKDGMKNIAKIHKEVYDTEPRGEIYHQVSKALKAAGYTFYFNSFGDLKKSAQENKPVAKKKVGAVVKDPKYMAQYHNAITQINASQKVLDEIALRMKLRPHPAMKLQMKESQAKIKKYISEMKTHARELKKLI